MGTTKRQRQRAGRQARLQAQQAAQKRQQTKRRGVGLAALLVAFVGIAVVFGIIFGGDDDDDEVVTGGSTSSTGVDSTVPVEASTTLPADPNAPFTYGTGACAPVEKATSVPTFDDAPQQCIDAAASYTAVFETSEGPITVALDTERTPGTVNNFVNLARSGYYDGSVIFRTDPSIDIIQGGGKTNSDSPGYSIPDEGGSFTYTEGDLVMARTGAPNSAGGQFFFVAGPAASALDGQGTYVTFARVTEGLDVVQAILALHEDQPDNPLGGAPSRPVTVETVSITES